MVELDKFKVQKHLLKQCLEMLQVKVNTYEHDLETGKNVEFFTVSKEEYETAKNFIAKGNAILEKTKVRDALAQVLHDFGV